MAFQGLTVSCARCHDHKFDAITAGDYYSLYGILRGSRLHYANVADPAAQAKGSSALREAKRELMDAVFSAAEEEAATLPKIFAAMRAVQDAPDHRGHVNALNAKLSRSETAENREKQFRAAREAEVVKAATAAGVDPEIVMNWLVFASSRRSAPELAVLQGLLAGDKLDALRLKAARVDVVGEKYAFGLTDQSLGEWIVTGPGIRPAAEDGFLPALRGDAILRTAVGGGAMSAALSGRLDGVVRSPDFLLDGKPVELWVRGKNAAVHLVVRNYELVGYGPTTKRLRVEVNSERWTRIGFSTDLWEGEPAYLEVQHQGAGMKCLQKNQGPAAPADDAWVAVAAGALPRSGAVWLPPMIETEESATVAAKVIAALSALARQGELGGAEREVFGALITSGLLLSEAAAHPQVKTRLEEFRDLAAKLPRPIYVRSLADGRPYDQAVYVRGDHKNISKEENPRRFLDGLGGARLESPGSGRLDWARHVASEDNPLTARVRVNRIWSRLFGRGLVASIDDFGKMGELPSHPELLDYLARDFMENGWSTKALIRKLVLSRAFRGSSTPVEGMQELDPKNIYLTHMPVRRMDAEAIRDHILACSGELRRELYGPSVPANIDDQPNSRAKPRSGPLDGNGRRSLYVETRRNYLSSFLRVFDMPNATEPVGRRNVTNVPAQSLALMNDRFVHEQSRIWAGRIMGREGSTNDRLQVLHRQAFGRDATAAELGWATKVLGELGGEASEEAWAALCHLMINRKEFIYVF